MIKSRLARIVFLFSLLVNAGSVIAQSDSLRQQPCDVNVFQASIDSLKQLYTGQGYTFLREAAMTMENEYEMPIVLPMNQGTAYQFVFIGDTSSRSHEVRMFDYSERQVIYRKNLWGDTAAHIISFNYVPASTEYHMIKPVQMNKSKKKLCGYVLLMVKAANTGSLRQ